MKVFDANELSSLTNIWKFLFTKILLSQISNSFIYACEYDVHFSNWTGVVVKLTKRVGLGSRSKNRLIMNDADWFPLFNIYYISFSRWFDMDGAWNWIGLKQQEFSIQKKSGML